MELGIFADVFARPTLEERFAAVAAHGLSAVQFNMASTGLPAMPDAIEPELVERIRQAADASGVRIAALSGTFNMIHPNPRVREQGLRRLGILAGICAGLGTSVITLCTGTRDPDDMWRRHPANDLPDAWNDLVTSMTAALEITDASGVSLAFEPEPGNVVRTARQARDLIDQLGSRRLSVVLDPANVFEAHQVAQLPAILDEAIDLLGDRIFLAHGKDRDADWQVRPAGQGIVPWDRFFVLLRSAGYDGAVVLHGLAESDVGAAVNYLGERLNLR